MAPLSTACAHRVQAVGRSGLTSSFQIGVPGSFARSVPHYLEANAPGVTKGSALRFLLTRLYDWLGRILPARGARGVILWSWFACDLWRAAATSLREAFGLPLLLLDAGDGTPASARDNGRVEAFVESLR